MSDKTTLLYCEDVHKTYRDGKKSVEVLKGVNLNITSGEKVAIIGASGSGKSTLLNILGGLDAPSSGTVLLADIDINSISEVQRCKIRNRNMGFVYQFHHLLGEFSALENVAMPLLIGGESQKNSRVLAANVLNSMSLGERFDHKPGELSGGERQRVAIARALVGKPCCVLMDEPTGNLDLQSAEQILTLIDSLAKDSTSSFVLVTHDHYVAGRMDRVLELKDGELQVVG
jgi:lipoprotein-releasing system ATP-binding protein